MTTNDIDNEGLRFLGEALKQNDTLVSVKLYYNHFDQSALKVFHLLMQDKTRGSDWFFDFKTYFVDNKL